MSDDRRAWRDALRDLGVMGLVPDPVAAPAPAAPVVQAAPERTLVPERAPSPRPSAPLPLPLAPPMAPRTLARPHAAAPAAEYVPPSDPRGNPPLEAVASAKDLKELEARICDCLKCPLGPGRIKFVFGEGSAAAPILFVGEGPGRDEDLSGRPFVGRAGELLDKMIGAIGMKRDDVYIANVVKCRPPDNRTPTPPEAHACLGYLHRQIELLRPKVIVCLGATPLKYLTGATEGITKARGKWQRYEPLDIPVMPTFHPAYVLRQYTQEVRRAVWEDLKAAKDWIEKAEG